MDILKQIKLYKMKRTVYRMVSPIFSIHYYMNNKYGLERGIPPYSVVRDNLKRAHSFAVKDFIVEALANVFKGEVRYLFEPEIDGIIVDRRERPLAVVEVKWGHITTRDIKMFKEKSRTWGSVEEELLLRKIP